VCDAAVVLWYLMPACSQMRGCSCVMVLRPMIHVFIMCVLDTLLGTAGLAGIKQRVGAPNWCLQPHCATHWILSCVEVMGEALVTRCEALR
jgi:hypothetical protein